MGVILSSNGFSSTLGFVSSSSNIAGPVCAGCGHQKERPSIGTRSCPKAFISFEDRWVVERTNAWITHHRRLSRDFEGTSTSSEAFIYLAMSRLMVARLARPSP